MKVIYRFWRILNTPIPHTPPGPAMIAFVLAVGLATMCLTGFIVQGFANALMR